MSPVRDEAPIDDQIERLRVLGEEGIVAGVVAQAAIFFVFVKIADADFGEVGGGTLVDLLEGKIFVFDIVGAGLHVFAVVNGGGNDGTSLLNTNAKLFCGGFVIGNEETVADTGAVGNVEVDGAVIVGSENRGKGASAEGELHGDAARVGLHAAEKAGVLMKESEKHYGAEKREREMPGLWRKRGEPTQKEDGGDESQSRDKSANPSGVGVGLDVFGEKRGGGEGKQIEFENETAALPEWETTVQLHSRDNGGDESEGDGGVGEPFVALAEDVELVGAVLHPERLFAIFDIVVVGNVEAGADDDEQTGDEENEFVVAGKAGPEKSIGSGAEEP